MIAKTLMVFLITFIIHKAVNLQPTWGIITLQGEIIGILFVITAIAIAAVLPIVTMIISLTRGYVLVWHMPPGNRAVKCSRIILKRVTSPWSHARCPRQLAAKIERPFGAILFTGWR